MATEEIIRFFILGWILMNLSLILPIYMTRIYWKLNKKVIYPIIIVALNLALGIFLTTILDHLRITEIQLILFGSSLFIAGSLIPQIYTVSKITQHQEFKFREDMVGQILDSSLSEFDAKIIEQKGPVELTATLKPAMWFEYLLTVGNNDVDSKLIDYTLKPVGSSETYFRLLFLVGVYPLIMSISSNSFIIPFFFISNTIDAEILFTILVVIIIVYLMLNNRNLQTFFPEFMKLQKQMMKNLVQKMISDKSKRRSDEDSNESNESGGKINLDKAKEKAQKIKEMRFKETLIRKQEEIKERVDGIFNPDNEDSEGLEPELIRKQAMIRKIKTILVSTPLGKVVTLQDIADKVGEQDHGRVEQIIIGLLGKNEIQNGAYNIWDQTFVNGDINSRFIEKTLEHLDINPEDLDYIKLNLSGDVEIKFNTDTETIRQKSKEDE